MSNNNNDINEINKITSRRISKKWSIVLVTIISNSKDN